MKSRLIASLEVAGDYADILGHLAQQTEVLGYRPEPNGKSLGLAIHGEGLQNPETVRRLWDAFKAAHPDLVAGFSPSIHPETGHHGIEMILPTGGEKLQARLENEVRPNLDRIAGELGVNNPEARVFRAREMSREHDWEADPTGGSYLTRLSARYGPYLPNRMELFARQKRDPVIRQEIQQALAEGKAGGVREAGPEITPSTTAPDLGAVSRRVTHRVTRRPTPSNRAKKGYCLGPSPCGAVTHGVSASVRKTANH
jgi:hypothetical protein